MSFGSFFRPAMKSFFGNCLQNSSRRDSDLNYSSHKSRHNFTPLTMMIKPWSGVIRSLYHCQARSFSDYNIFAAVCIERQPIIAPEMNIVEKTVKQYLARIEDIQSIYSDHEMRHFEDLKRAERLATQTKVDEKDVEAATKQTAQDFEDQSQRQLAQFKFGSKSFGPDIEKNMKSMERCLDRRLLLLTKIKLGNNYKWIVPASQVKSDETLRQAAERTLSDCFGPKSPLKVTFLSSAPGAVYSYNVPVKFRSSNDGKKGVRMFFLKSFVASGSIKDEEVNKELVQDYAWLNREEIEELMRKEKQKDYWKSLGRSLLKESMSEETVKKILARVRRNVTREEKDVEIEMKRKN